MKLSFICIALLLAGRFEAFSQCSLIDFTPDVTKGCSPLVVHFKATGAPAGSSYVWDFGNGAVNGQDTIVKAFTVPGLYTIRLTVTLPGGTVCNFSKVDLIETLPTPNPDVVVSPGQVLCNGPKEVTFTDNTPGVVSRQWVIDGTVYKNAGNVVKYKFTSTGNKSVSLQVTNSSGCIGLLSDNKYIRITDSVETDFCGVIVVSDTNTTLKATANITTKGRTISKYEWNFPGGSPSSYVGINPPKVTYPGNKVNRDVWLTITMADGCQYTAYKKNYIQQFITIPKDTVCVGQAFYLTNKANNNGRGFFEWNFPNAFIDPERSSNGGQYLAYSGAAGPQDFSYSFRYTQTGCQTQVSYPGYIFVNGPKTFFNSDNKVSCNPNERVRFKNLTQLYGAANVTYTWRFYNDKDIQIPGAVIGPTATLDTSWVFGKEGKFGVSLVAKSTNGCADSMYMPQFVNINKPKADFYMEDSTVCAGTSIQFISDPTPAEEKGTTYKYIWNIQHADSAPIFYTLTGKTPSLTPIIPGIYHVKLIVQTSSACSDTIYKKNYLTVNGVFSSFTIDDPDGCPNPYFNTVLRMSNKVLKYPNSPFNTIKTEWKVDPGDDVLIVSPTASNTPVYFNSPGTYTVTLNFYDSYNCTTQVVKKDIINVGAKAGFEIKERKCLGDSHIVSSFSDLSINKYKWIGEPSKYVKFYPSDSVREPRIIFTKDTCFSLTLVGMKLIDGEYCKDTFRSLRCTNLPKAGFVALDTNMYCAPQIARFEADTTNFAKYWLWDFGDGSTLYTDNPKPSHVYLINNPKGFTVKVVAIDTINCADTLVKKNLIKITGPAPSFTADNHKGCDSLVVTFRNTSDNVNNFLLILDDGTDPLMVDSVTHTYYMDDLSADSTYFYPILIALDKEDCTPFHKDTIKLYRTPRSDFVADSVIGCVPMGANFTDRSYNAVAWAWDLNGDGIIDDSTSSPHFDYTKPGKYDVSLWTINAGDCPDITVKKGFIEVLPIPEANFSMSRDSICGSGEVNFVNKSFDYHYFKIDYGDGTLPDSSLLAPHVYYYDEKRDSGDSVIFVPQLTVYSKSGCFDLYMDTITVYANPMTAFKADITSGCSPLRVQFKDSTVHAVRWEWDFDNNGSVDSRDQNPMHIFTSGFHTVKLKTYGLSGCPDSLIYVNMIEVNPVPVADFAVSDSVICLNEQVDFADMSVPRANVHKWRWHFDDALGLPDSSFNQNPSHTFRSIGYHNISLIVEDDKGCMDTVMRRAVYVEDTLRPQNAQILYVTVVDSGIIKAVWNSNDVYDFNDYTLRRTGAISQNIYNSANRKDTSYTDNDPSLLTDYKSYCYGIKTTDACGNASDESNRHCTMLLQGNGINSGKAYLSWSPYSGWIPSRYVIWRAGGNMQYKRLDSIPGTAATEYNDSNLCDETYTYYIEAVHPAAGYVSLSNKVRIHPPYEQQESPLVLRLATVQNGRNVKIYWERSRQENVKLYIIDRYAAEEGWQKNYAIVSQEEFTDVNVDVFHNIYTYRVRCQDACGYMSPYSNIANSILLKQEIQLDQVALAWNPYTYWAAGVSVYQVQLLDKNKNFVTIATMPGTDTVFVDDSLYSEIDTAYCYRVLAVENNLNGDTSVSNVTCSVLPSRIYVPNAFTPGNKDSLNREWKVSSVSIYNNVGETLRNFNMRIYNRWGQLVFESNDLHKGWDGTSQGGEAPESVYLYTIHAEGLDGRSFHIKGNLTLLRH